MEDSRELREAKRLVEEYRKTKDTTKLQEAIRILKNRDSVSSLNELGLIYLEIGEVRNAIEVFERALSKAKNEYDKNVIKFNLALALYKNKELSRACEILKDLTATSIKTQALVLMAKVCLSYGDVKHVEEAKNILETFEIPNEDLIVAYIFLGRHTNNKEYLEKAVKLAEVLKNKKLLAEALLSFDEKEKVEKALEIFRELNDINGEVKALYKLSFYQPELLYEALQRLEESKNSSPQDKIKILNELYKRTGLLNFLKEAISLAEKEKEYLFLARAYVELSKKENEVENLRKAVFYYEEFIRETYKSD